MYERRSEPLLPLEEFLRRMVRHVGIGMVGIVGSLLVGMTGYHLTERLGWLDAFLNASMLLGGMGPVDAPKTAGGKLFAGLYALYCGLAVLLIAGIMLGPI